MLFRTFAVHIALSRMASRVVVLMLTVTSVMVASCDGAADLLAGCGNEVVRSVISPSGSKTAIAFVRDCGATTGYSTQVSVVHGRKSEVTGSGNVLIVEGRPELEMRWTSDSEILVSRPGPGRIFKQEEQLSGTTIKYAY